MIKLEHISKTFGDTGDGVHAVKDVSLEIGDGEIFGIIGFSGAGKSTLVRCINLLERPTSGSITVNGQKLTWMEQQADGKSCMRTVSPQELRQARKKISMIFQGFNLLMQRTCLKNVCFPMELSGVPKAQAEKKALELLDLVGLKEKASAYPAQLSGGQKQRVAIARALATDPKVLLCDEATSALDPTTTNSILALLKELNQKLGVTVVIITHQMSVIEEICTRVAILDGGEVARGRPGGGHLRPSRHRRGPPSGVSRRRQRLSSTPQAPGPSGSPSTAARSTIPLSPRWRSSAASKSTFWALTPGISTARPSAPCSCFCRTIPTRLPRL